MRNQAIIWKASFLLPLLLFMSSLVSAQTLSVTPRAKEISEAEITLSRYDCDTSASVVVLWDNRRVEVKFDSQLNLKKYIHRTERIKILKEDGLDYADHEFRLCSKVGQARLLSRASATTYNMVDGSVVVSKMPKSNIRRTDDGDGFFKQSFSPVDVRVGSVVEVSYDITSDYFWDLGIFYLQRDVPVNLVTLEVSTPEWLRFNKNTKGYYPILNESTTENAMVAVSGGTGSVQMTTDRFKSVDLPAMKKEPYVYDVSQYMNSVEYIVYALQIPGDYREYNTTWENVDKEVVSSGIYKGVHASTPFKSKIDEIKKMSLDDMEKIERIRAAVTSAVQWNKKSDLIPNSPSSAAKSGAGTDAEINSLVGAALNYAGYVTEPVLVRERSSGVLLEYSPNSGAFDVFILEVTLPDGTKVYFDPSRKNTYYNLLPDDDLVTNARRVTKEGGEWVDLSGKGMSYNHITTFATLSPDGRLEGKYTVLNSGLIAAENKYYFSNTDEAGIIDDLENDMSVTVKDLSTKGMDEWSSSCSYELNFEKQLDKVASTIYLPAFIEKYHDKSAFKNPERIYPVIFPTSHSLVYTMELKLPEGYKLESLPEPAAVSFPQLSAVAKLQVRAAADDTIVINYAYKRGKSFLDVQEYENLRTFWEYLCGIYDSMITIKKAE